MSGDVSRWQRVRERARDAEARVDYVRASLRYLIEQEDRSHDAYRETAARGFTGAQAIALLESLADACAARSMAYRVALALLDVPADDPGPMTLAASLAAHEKGI